MAWPKKCCPVLILAAHPDDEVLGAGGFAAVSKSPLAVAFLTDGVPVDHDFFAPGYHDPVVYRDARQQEALRAWKRLRPRRDQASYLFFHTARDQQLAFALAPAWRWLRQMVDRFSPRLILCPAYEGGHPDHDAANFLGSQLAKRSRGRLTALEYPLYTVRRNQVLYQCFIRGGRRRFLSAVALRRKFAALAEYASQREMVRNFDPAVERFRPLPKRDYSRPERREPTVYERWGLAITPTDVCRQFRVFTP